MKHLFSEKLLRFAQTLDRPLYAVGGFTRDFLAGLQGKHSDIDLCGAIPAKELTQKAEEFGFLIRAVYANTGTVKLQEDSGEDYEYTCFRSDKYIRGRRTPSEIFFTDDITLDAKRRDFTVNAIYYNLKTGEFVDPLGGIPAVREKRLTTVCEAKKVFGEDGLRLMRLARQCAQLGFTPDDDCLAGATQHSALILDIAAERIFAELSLLLNADEKYGVEGGHYQGLLCLEKTGVLSKILPELTLGKGMAQRSDYHRYDVLNHSLRAVYYAQKEVRLAALLHDVGKPYCQLRDGKMYGHPEEGARIAEEILHRLKAPKKTVSEVKELVKWHMYDFDLAVKENKLRRFFVDHLPILDKLLLVKQADFSACRDDTSIAPTVKKWKALLDKMKVENAPMQIKDLALRGDELPPLGVPTKSIAEVLKELLYFAVCEPTLNTKEKLIKLVPAALKTVKDRQHS